MTIRERLRNIGLAIRGRDTVKEIVKVVKEAEKSIIGGTANFGITGLSDEARVSTKVLRANSGWVYRNTDVIASEVGTIEFKLYTARIVGNEIQYNPITSHPILDALDRFNEFTDASSGFYTTEAHKLLAGDSFWFIDGNGSNINGIYLLPPDKIEIKLGEIAGTQRIIDGYIYRDDVKGKQIDIVYDPEQIIHFKSPNPRNPYRGLGKVEAAADTIDSDSLAIEANKKLFTRGLISQFILTSENKLTDEQLKQLHAQFQSSYGGIDNAFKVPILGSGLKPQTVQMTNKDMEFIAQQEWNRDKITAIWGNNKAVIGVTDDVNRANAEESTAQWRRTTIRGEMKAICDTLNEFFVPRFGTNLILGFEDPVPEDSKADIDEIKVLIEANVITPNEARERMALDPIKDPEADSLRKNPTPEVPDIPPPLKYISRSKFLRRSGLAEKMEQKKKVLEVVRPVAKKIIEGRKKVKTKPVHQTISDTDVWNYYEKQMGLVDTLEKIFHDKVEKFIERLVEKALANVPEEISEMQRKQLINEEDEIVQAMIDFTPILNEVAIASGNIALDLIDYEKPYIPADIRGLIQKRVELFATSMVTTDKDKLIDIIAAGLQDGKSIPEIRKQITETFDQYSKTQAQRITRTEVLRTSNIAAVDAWEQSGVVVGKQWLVAPGADAECLVYNGKIKVLDGNFYNSQNEFENGDPPIHPNCRCTLLPVLVDEKDIDLGYFNRKSLEMQKQELEAKIDKRSKAYKQLKNKNLELEAYVKELEDYLDET